ncbi:aspartyl/asparaginyl beta-hydroxylase-like isoform X2 [Alligator sinensis]|uniref:Aspartyl/asparaginyl beta-hydroxylase-like isoform X2 n=1 Tax=Alligator sinensis TaxID=38654 RepID=A0A3Q0G837_ALLSI|nr:aspartyl/asparaginyl beta-hydroxylase-like isoform X2 [Alligator sinensis]
MAEDTETKHGGSKNGKKEGLSGSSFFTWFMVIALLGVWTSVAVVWFELIDYEEVLAKAKDFRYNLSEVLQGKLGIYDADGDGDFDVEDAKVLLGLTKDGSNENIDSLEEVLNILAEESSDWFYGFLSFLYDVLTPFEILEEEESEAADDVDGKEPGGVVERKAKDKGLKERYVPAQRTPAETEESIQPSEQSFIKSEHEIGEPKVEEEIQSVLQEEHHSQFDYQVDEPDENQADEPEVQEPETVEIPVSYKHDLVLEKATNEPEVSDDIESFIEENIEYPPEDMIQEDYNEEHEPKHEEETEIQDPGTDDIDTTVYAESETAEKEYITGMADVEDERALPEPVNEATEPGEIPEDVEINEKPLEVKHTEDQVVAEPHETEIPVQAEDFLRDDLVDT